MSSHKNAKKSKCKYESPICNDRAEAFVGPRAKILPRFSEVPSEWDKRAFELAAKGMSQREIAKELKKSQTTVHRGIKKYRVWFGMTLPEDRGELVGWARFRVAVEERKIFLRHQQELAMEEWHESRKPMPMKRKRTKLDPQGQEMDGMPIKDIQIDEYVQRRHASAAHLNAAARRSDELTMLEAGYLGVHKLTCDQVIDTDERDRWDRDVKSLEATVARLTATIAGLTQKLAELEAKLAAVSAPGSGVFGTSDSPLPSTSQPKSPDPLARHTEDGVEPGAQPKGSGLFGGCVLPEAQSLAPKTPDPDHESRKAQTTPSVNQTSPDSQVASPIQDTPSGERPDSSPSVSQKPESDESGAKSVPPPRWSDAERQEALDYFCQIHNLPPATLAQTSGIPNYRHITPLEAIKRGFPCMISIDRTAEIEREWNRREWERNERLKRQPF